MFKTHIRSYRVADHGDLVVVDLRAREAADISSHYEDVPRDRGGMRLETSVDVFRFPDGNIVWSATANGQDSAAAASLALLLGLFLEDASGVSGVPRNL